MASGSFPAPGGNTGLASPELGRTCELIPTPEPPTLEPVNGRLGVEGAKVLEPSVDGLDVFVGTEEGAVWYVGGPIGMTLIAPGTLGTVDAFGIMADEMPCGLVGQTPFTQLRALLGAVYIGVPVPAMLDPTIVGVGTALL
jgi:hypothetical protein